MLSDKDRELIGIGASIAAGCEPCASFHLRAAQIAGANDTEISQAVNDALTVRRCATEGMARFTALHLGGSTPEMSGSQTSPLLGELISISAAFAVNSVADLETHIAVARALGATKGQILAAIKIASAVKGIAAGKVEEAARRAAEAMPRASADCGPGCACRSQVESRK
jgi:AhpD family alkylhydroperoxidase